jgi:hypothetical protein
LALQAGSASLREEVLETCLGADQRFHSHLEAAPAVAGRAVMVRDGVGKFLNKEIFQAEGDI